MRTFAHLDTDTGVVNMYRDCDCCHEQVYATTSIDVLMGDYKIWEDVKGGEYHDSCDIVDYTEADWRDYRNSTILYDEYELRVKAWAKELGCNMYELNIN